MNKDAHPDPPRGVLARFPNSEGRIRRLFQGDEVFYELCADHGECMKTLQRFRKMDTGPDERIEQYTELLVSLEAELFVRISEPANDETAVEAKH